MGLLAEVESRFGVAERLTRPRAPSILTVQRVLDQRPCLSVHSFYLSTECFLDYRKNSYTMRLIRTNHEHVIPQRQNALLSKAASEV